MSRPFDIKNIVQGPEILFAHLKTALDKNYVILHIFVLGSNMTVSSPSSTHREPLLIDNWALWLQVGYAISRKAEPT